MLNTLFPLRQDDLNKLTKDELVTLAHVRNIDIGTLNTKRDIAIAILKRFRQKVNPVFLEHLTEVELGALTVNQLIEYAERVDINLDDLLTPAGNLKAGVTKGFLVHYIYEAENQT